MKWILWAFLIAGQALDAGTSCAAFKRGGFSESNPLLPSSCGGIVAIKAGLTGGASIISVKVGKKARITIQLSVGGAGMVAGLMNLRRIQ